MKIVNHLHFQILYIALALVCVSNVIAAYSQEMTWEQFSTLPQEEQKSIILQSFEKRMNLMKNMRYVCRETMDAPPFVNGKAGVSSRPPVERVFHHYLFENTYRQATDAVTHVNENLTVTLKYQSSFDRQEGIMRGTFWEERYGDKRLAGRIDTVQDRVVTENRFWHWLRADFVTSETSGDIREDQHIFPLLVSTANDWKIQLLSEQQMIQLDIQFIAHISDDLKFPGKATFILDYQKGFMPIKGKSYNEGFFSPKRAERGDKSWQDRNFTVEKSVLVGSIWMPTHLQEEQTSSVIPGFCNIFKMEISDIEFGTVTKKDVEIQFPEGAEIVDAIEGVFYKTDANGKPIETTIEPLYELDPQSVAEIPEKKYPVANYIFIGAGLLLIGVALYLIYKERKGK
ncbi:hypothetical protein FACS189419_06460 [Planctomycetales bacterium]|nr:hypothetical protein FACS189419_06460 [Planctomycetales bacterium]